MGVRLPLFNYTSKKILTMRKYNEYVQKEIRRVKTMKNPKNAGWIFKPRRNHSIIYENDCVGRLSGVGKEAKKKLTEAGLTQVFQLAAIGNNEQEIKESINEIANETKLTVSFIQKLHLQALDAEHGEFPKEVNHLLSDNPYKSRYGNDWKEEIKKTKIMRPYICVSELVLHIVEETKKAYKGTKYEETYLFYHDALSQMTDNETIEWMRAEGILHRWIRPVLELNDVITVGEKSSENYAGRPVGN